MTNRKYRAAVGLLSLLVIPSLTRVTIAAQQSPPPQQSAAPQLSDDPFVWLEDIDGQRSMDWVNTKNAATIAALTRSPLYQSFYDRIKQILDSKDKIANPEIIGNSLYNFWQDAEHERGIWRRTSWASYATAHPSWETVLDVDSLSKADGVTWSFGGADCFEPEYKRCIIALSRGGSDATETREFDLTSKTFVSDGFKIPEAKTSTAWVDDSTLLVGTDEQGAVIDPGRAGFRFGNLESVGDERLAGEIELTCLRGVGPAARKRDDAALVFGLEAVGATEGPRHTVRFAERIHVEHGFPRWMGGCIASPARSPPDPALVLRVLPEVVERVPDDLGIGDLVLGIEDLFDPIVE